MWESMCHVMYEQLYTKILSFVCETFSGYSCLTVLATRKCEASLPFFLFLRRPLLGWLNFSQLLYVNYCFYCVHHVNFMRHGLAYLIQLICTLHMHNNAFESPNLFKMCLGFVLSSAPRSFNNQCLSCRTRLPSRNIRRSNLEDKQ